MSDEELGGRMLARVCKLVNDIQWALYEEWQATERTRVAIGDDGWAGGWAEGVSVGYRNAFFAARDLLTESGLPLSDGPEGQGKPVDDATGAVGDRRDEPLTSPSREEGLREALEKIAAIYPFDRHDSVLTAGNRLNSAINRAISALRHAGGGE